MMKEISIDKWARYYYAMVFLFVIKQWYSCLLLHQFQNPVLIYPNIDNTYWVFHLLQIPYFIAQHISAAYLIDTGLLFLPLILLIDKHRSLVARLFFVWFFVYFICVNTFSGHHSHMLIGILLGNFIFCMKSADQQYKSIHILRYYLLFMMVSAGLWKISRGSVFDADHMSNLLFNQNIYAILAAEKSYWTNFIDFLIKHKQYSHLLYISATVLELSFVIGFFSRKYDVMLGLLFILFFLFDYLLMDLNFIEISILLLALLPIKRN